MEKGKPGVRVSSFLRAIFFFQVLLIRLVRLPGKVVYTFKKLLINLPIDLDVLIAPEHD